MARSRQTRPEGPPGLGGTPANYRDGENPTPGRENPPFDGTNRESEAKDIPWSGRGIESERADPSQEMIEDLMRLPVAMAKESERLNTLWSEFVDQNSVVEQINGQLRALEQQSGQRATVLEEHRNAIVVLQQRLEALARQQVNTNTRLIALQLAVQGKNSHDAAEKVVEQAERFYRFLLKDLVLSAPPQEVKIIDGLDPDETTTH